MNQRELSIVLQVVLILLVCESPNNSLSSVVIIFMKNAYLQGFLESFQIGSYYWTRSMQRP
jgi:hypothetical protein